jgi:hypothetical protein
MLKRFVGLAISSLLLGGMIQAQDAAQGNYVFDTPVDIEEIGTQFYLPADWTLDLDNRIFAQNADDLPFITDLDSDTNATEPYIILSVVPIDESLEGVTLTEFADQGYNSLTVEERLPLSIRGRYVDVALGSVPGSDRNVLSGVWRQGTYFVIAAMILGEGENYLDYSFDFGAFLASSRLFGAVSMPEVAEDTINGVTYIYPEDTAFFLNEEAATAYVFFNPEDQSELTGGAGADEVIEDSFFLMQQVPLVAFELDTDATAQDLMDVLTERLALEDVVFDGEAYVNGLEGGMFYATQVLGDLRLRFHITLIINPETENGIFYQMSAFDEEVLAEDLPSYFMMLGSVEPLESQ